jgi:CHAT domain-containing protein
MIQFYQQFISNQKPRGEALRLAQISLLSGEDPTFKHPYYWAAFVLVGNWQ